MEKTTTLTIIFIIALILIYISIFIIPGSASKFSLDSEKIFKEGENWRFLTYPFAHFNSDHLIKNLIGLFIITAIIFELKTKFSWFSSNYLLSGFFAIIPLWLALQFTALGASTAIYGTFGIISLEVSKLHIKTFYIILAVIGIIALESLFVFVSGQSIVFVLTQASAHFSGLLFGIIFFLCINRTKKLFSKRKNLCLRRLK